MLTWRLPFCLFLSASSGALSAYLLKRKKHLEDYGVQKKNIMYDVNDVFMESWFGIFQAAVPLTGYFGIQSDICVELTS